MSGPLSISKAIEKNENNLLRMGYTVDYTSILAHLYNPLKKKTTNVSTNSSDVALSTMTYSEYYATLLGTADSLGTISNGYVQEVELQQAVCIVKPFLSFPAKAKDDKIYNIPVEVPDNSQINGGATLSGAGTTIPTTVDENYLNAFKGAGNNFLIGVGLDLDNFVPEYLKHFYGGENSEWKSLDESVIPNLKTMAEKRMLYAEITFNIGGTGKILNAPIIINNSGSTPLQDASTLHHLWIPCPLIHLNDYKALGEVAFEHAGKTVSVHTGGYSYPFADSGYIHKNGSIRGLTSDYYKSNVVSHKPSFLPYKGIKWNAADVIENLPSKDVLARTRIYFDEEQKSEIETLIGEIPESCKRIYGPLKAIETKKLIDTSSILSYGGCEDIYWEEGMCPVGITKDIYITCLRIIWVYEKDIYSMNQMRTKDPCNVNLPLESFLSFGPNQFVQKSNNPRISLFLDTYESVCKEMNSEYNKSIIDDIRLIKTSGLSREDISKNSTTADGKRIQNLRELWLKDSRFRYSYFKHYAKTTKQDSESCLRGVNNLFKTLGLSSPMGYFCCMDIKNQGESQFNRTLVKGKSSEAEKIREILRQRTNDSRSYMKKKWKDIKTNFEQAINENKLDMSLAVSQNWKGKKLQNN